MNVEEQAEALRPLFPAIMCSKVEGSVVSVHAGGETVHERARRGISGGGGRLPHYERIQAALEEHDLSSVQAHTGAEADSACCELGATAYTMGEHVVLGARGQDLKTVAHEATHVVQQRSGVTLEGGIGKAGDRYEREADAVADKVVAGESVCGSGDGGGVRMQRDNRAVSVWQAEREAAMSPNTACCIQLQSGPSWHDYDDMPAEVRERYSNRSEERPPGDERESGVLRDGLQRLRISPSELGLVVPVLPAIGSSSPFLFADVRGGIIRNLYYVLQERPTSVQFLFSLEGEFLDTVPFDPPITRSPFQLDTLVFGPALARSLYRFMSREAARNLASRTAHRITSPMELLRPDGQLLGKAGTRGSIRVVRDGAAEAERFFQRLSAGGRVVTPRGHPGTLVELPGGGVVGYRPVSVSGPPTIDVNIPGLSEITKIKFLP